MSADEDFEFDDGAEDWGDEFDEVNDWDDSLVNTMSIKRQINHILLFRVSCCGQSFGVDFIIGMELAFPIIVLIIIIHKA